MGGAQSYRRQSRPYGYADYFGTLPPEDMFSGYYVGVQSSYPVPHLSPVDRMGMDPYVQYPGYYGGGMRRGNSDPNLAAYDPYMQYGMPQEGFYDMQDPYRAPYGAYGYPFPPEVPAMGPRRWGSLPNLHDHDYIQLARNTRDRPFLQRLFGTNSVAQRRNILKRLDQQQIDPFTKTAQWLLHSDQRRVR